MANTYKVLGQAFPLSATLAALYTVPALTSALGSSIVITNQSPTVTDTVRVAVAVAGAADTPAQYLYYDLSLPPKATFVATIGMTLAAADVVRVYSTSGVSSFNLFGQEVT